MPRDHYLAGGVDLVDLERVPAVNRASGLEPSCHYDVARSTKELADQPASPNRADLLRESPSTLVAKTTPTIILNALNLSNVGIIYCGADCRVIEANDVYGNLVGLEREELVGSPLQAHICPIDAQAFLDLYKHHCPAAVPFHMEMHYLRPDATARRAMVHVCFLQDPEGLPTGSVTVVLDITAQRAAELALRESEDHYRNTVELAAQISWTASPDGLMDDVSPVLEKITGSSSKDTLGNGWHVLMPEDDIEPTMSAWALALESKQPVDVEYRLRTSNGSYRWFRSRAAPRLDAFGNVLRWYGTVEDVDDRKRAEEALRESEERFRLAAHAAGLGVWDFDAAQGRSEWSDEFKAMLGLPKDAEPLAADALARVLPEDRQQLQRLIEAVQAGDSEHRFDMMLRICRADDGAERRMQTSGWRTTGSNGKIARILVTIRDITEQHEADQRIRWTANHDPLTGLPNRRFFNEQLELAFGRARREGSKLGLLLFDIDNLKETNDTIGHYAGDLILKHFARCLQDSLGRGFFLARLGGDEFAAIVRVDDETDMVNVVDAALRGVRNEFDHDGVSLSCQVTAGAAKFPKHAENAEDLLKMADIALYAGKATKRGTLSVFRPDMRASVQQRASMLAVARTVINGGRVQAYYQPKVALADGSLIGFEALLRWRHDTMGVQGPGMLAAAFEDLNLATRLGEHMLDCVCKDVRSWLDQGLTFGHVGVNLSPAEFRRDDLFDRFMERLNRSNISPSLIEIEVTETVFLGRGTETVADMLSAFHKEGVSIALDDFGTGFASLTHLQSFPVDVIKIDRGFVTNLTAESGNAAIVDAIIGLAGRLGMKVIAEGIETEEEATYLIDRGCKYGQGFLFAKPGDADNARQFIGLKQ